MTQLEQILLLAEKGYTKDEINTLLSNEVDTTVETHRNETNNRMDTNNSGITSKSESENKTIKEGTETSAETFQTFNKSDETPPTISKLEESYQNLLSKIDSLTKSIHESNIRANTIDTSKAESVDDILKKMLDEV